MVKLKLPITQCHGIYSPLCSASQPDVQDWVVSWVSNGVNPGLAVR